MFEFIQSSHFHAYGNAVIAAKIGKCNDGVHGEFVKFTPIPDEVAIKFQERFANEIASVGLGSGKSEYLINLVNASTKKELLCEIEKHKNLFDGWIPLIKKSKFILSPTGKRNEN